MTKAKAVVPIDVLKQFLDAHQGIDDLRLHLLLWFNAFEHTVTDILAWRLGCEPDTLRRAINISSSTVFDLALVGQKELRGRVDKLLKTRNSVASVS